MYLIFSISAVIDNETGQIWTIPDPNQKITAREKRAKRKQRRQERRNY